MSAAAEFQEVFMVKLTTSTTCYSTPRRVPQEDVSENDDDGPACCWTAHLATEKHVVGMELVGTNRTARPEGEETEGNEPGHDDINGTMNIQEDCVRFHEYPVTQTLLGVPRKIAKKLICVGYSSSQIQPTREDDDEEESLWEAMILLDTTKSKQESSSALTSTNNNANTANTTAGSTNNFDDDRTVATVDTSATTSTGTTTTTAAATNATTTNIRRRKSVDSTASTGAPSGGPPPKLANLQEEHEDAGVQGQAPQPDQGNKESSQPVARLLLYNRQLGKHFYKGLDFRPLSPCIQVINNGNDRRPVVLLWIGSADDSKLHLFRPPDDDDEDAMSSDALVEMSLEQHETLPTPAVGDDDPETKNDQPERTPPFSFPSPIMAIDSFALLGQPHPAKMTNTDMGNVYNNILAVACQDGTLRMIGYTVSSNLALECREEYTVTVDGPIVSIALHYKNDTQIVEAVFGSLCGYVARFVKPIHHPVENINDIDDGLGNWRGPFMVAEGFWMNGQVQEDSVLSVSAWDDKVAVGTYSGRCLLYGQFSENETDDYGPPFWDCQLPDSIHGICVIPTTKSSMLLLVTTRKSIHIFQEIPKYYYADMARKKLEFLLSRQRPHKPTMPAAAIERAPSPLLEIQEKLTERVSLPSDDAVLSPTSEATEESQKPD